MSRTLLRLLAELSGSQQEPAGVGAVECGPHGPPALILGPPGCRMSGFMFMAAALAAEEEGAVLYLCPEPLQTVPKAGRAARDPLILKQIRFVYPPSMKELLQFFSSLHLTSPPSLILVDGLERYLPPACSLHDGAYISALMLDSISHIRCGLLVFAAPNSERTDGAFTAVERYFPNQCLMYHDVSCAGKEHMFKMSFMSLRAQWNLHIEEDGSVQVSACVTGEDHRSDIKD